MSKVQMLRALVKQRLTAAAEEIFGLFERTIAEYEEELCRSKEENHRQRHLLDAVFNPDVHLQAADVQQLLVSKEDIQQQDWSFSLDQEAPDPPQIKEEQEEGDTAESHLKSENDDDENLQSSQLHQRQTENREAELLLRKSSSDPDTDDKASGRSEPETDKSDGEWKQPQLALNCLKNTVHVSEKKSSAAEKPFRCSWCNKTFGYRHDLKRHTGVHAQEKHFICSVCGKRFNYSSSLTEHMRGHTGEKPFRCSVCKERFPRRSQLAVHIQSHSEEQLLSCSVCGKTFPWSSSLNIHMRIHTGVKPYSCSVCHRRFTQKSNLTRHMTVHTGEKSFKCSVCGKGFSRQEYLKNHKCVETSDADVGLL